MRSSLRPWSSSQHVLRSRMLACSSCRLCWTASKVRLPQSDCCDHLTNQCADIAGCCTAETAAKQFTLLVQCLTAVKVIQQSGRPPAA